MENSIQIFESSIDNLENSTTYVTDDAVRYFIAIRHVLDNIADDLVELETGAKGFTPKNFELARILFHNIETVEEFLRTANKNSVETADKVIDVRNILVRFSHIKKLMLSDNKEFRKDAIELFIRTGKLYPNAEMREFVSMLSESELQYVMQIVEQEKTLIEKTITNTPIHILASQKLNEMNALRATNKEGTNYEDER